jgi:hypothetical protein
VPGRNEAKGPAKGRAGTAGDADGRGMFGRGGGNERVRNHNCGT